MRDEKIDFLRFLGLTMIILAHVSPPGIIFQARNFDVPLMVIVAGLSFQASFKAGKYLPYLWSRVKRLIFPVWLFLSIYFLVNHLTGNTLLSLNLHQAVSSYLLLDGIGYVWIIRVFLLVAIVAPFIYSYNKKQRSHLRYFATLAASYLVYELFLLISLPLQASLAVTLLDYTILSLIPYAVVFAIGLRLPTLSRKQLMTVSWIALTVFMTWVCIHWVTFGKFLPTQEFKYPARSYYLSYALFVSFVAWSASEKVTTYLRQVRSLPFILFVGQNSIWIYLWHIPFVEIVNLPFYSKFPIVFFAATSITYLQVKLMKHYVIPNTPNARIKNNLRSLLTG